MKKLLLLLSCCLLSQSIAMASCAAFTYSSTSDSIVSQTNTGTAHYIDFVGGSDANNGTATGTPWKRHPYMVGFTGTYAHASGDCFYFKGGVTWPNSVFTLNMLLGGSSVGNEDYYGPDPTHTWFTGGTWSRPIFDIGAAAVSTVKVINYQAGFVIYDNFEVIRAFENTSANQTIWSPNAHNGVWWIRNHVHNFQPALTTDINEIVVAAWGGNVNITGAFAFNVVDGSDGNKGYKTEALRNAFSVPVVHNVFHDLCSAVNEHSNLVAYNLIYNIGPWGGQNIDCSQAGNGAYHPDGIQLDTDADIHDNVLHDTTGEAINYVPNATAGHTTSNIYNNVLYHNTPVPILIGNVGQPFPNGVTSIYNNTLECDSITAGNPCIRLGDSSIGTLTIMNNHYITLRGTATDAICANNAPINNAGCGTATTFTYNAASEVYQTIAAANAQGYNSSQTIVFSPTLASNSTVHGGSNLTSSCTSSILLCTDTAYGEMQTSNTATSARTVHSRPSSGAWDAGAYQFTFTPPQPPTGLTATPR